MKIQLPIKLELGRRELALIVGLAFIFFAGAVGMHALELRAAGQHVAQLEAVGAQQKAKLGAIDAQASRLAVELRRLERQNAEIRHAIGIGSTKRRSSTHAMGPHRVTSFVGVESRLARVARDSERARKDTLELRRLVARVLNLRRLEAIARVEMLARVPSIVPAGNGEIASSFGFRTSPFPEFHRGVDLAADYGDVVRAAAKGTVVWAGWDGGYGKEIEIDHGNGIRTWYCHLSRIAVVDGQSVVKGAPIGAVGSTGEATGPHLHYQVMEDGKAIDPAPFLEGRGAKILSLDTSGTLRR